MRSVLRARARARADVLGRALHPVGARGEIVGDVGELARRVARVADPEAPDDRVDHEDRPLAGLHDICARPCGRGTELGVDGLSRS